MGTRYSNESRFGTEDINEVMKMYDGMSDHFTYRQRVYNGSMDNCERLSYEREPDMWELEEYHDRVFYGYDKDFNQNEDDCGDVYDSDIDKLEYKE